MRFQKQIFIEYSVLFLQWYLCYYMMYYGYSKLVEGQFGAMNQEVLNTPLGKLDKFYISWYLFSLSRSFNFIIGILQMIGALLIVINKTRLIGALLLFPVLIGILLTDLAFTTGVLGYALPIRLFWMIISDIIIMYSNKKEIQIAFKSLLNVKKTAIQVKWWAYPFLLIIGILMDFFWGVISIPIKIWLRHL